MRPLPKRMTSRAIASGRVAVTSRPPSGQGSGLRSRPFRSLWLATGSANLGDGIARLALPLVVLGQGGSVVEVTAVALAGRLPWLVGALPAGLLVDRSDRRRAAITANLLRVALLGGIALSMLSGTSSVPLVLSVTFFIGLAEVVADSATQAMIPTVVASSDLTRANQRLIGTEMTANEFSGPALGGVVTALGAVVAFASAAGLFLVAAGMLLAMTPRLRTASPRHETVGVKRLRSGIADRLGAERLLEPNAGIMAGWRFIRATPVLRGVVLLVLCTSLAWSAQQAVLIAYLVSPGPGGLSPATFGFVLGGIGLGGVLGTVVVDRLVRAIGELRAIALDLIGSVALVAVPLLTADPWWVASATITAGFGSAVWSVLVSAMRQRLTPPDLIGRVSATYRLFSMGSVTAGAGAAVAIVAVTEVRVVFAVFTVVALLAFVPYLLWVRPAMVAQARAQTDG